MTNNQQPDPVSDPLAGAPVPGEQPAAGQPPQPYPAQPYPAQPYPAQPYPPQSQPPYPPQQFPAQEFPAQPPQQYPPEQPAAPLYPGQPQAYPQAYPGQPYPPQPYPAAPYPAGAYPQGPDQPQAYPQGTGQPPYPPAAYQPVPGQPPRKSRGKGPLILGITAGVAVLAVGVALVLPRAGVPQVTPRASGSATPVVVQTATAQAAVQGYLDALAKADAVTALAYAATPPTDTSLLTNDVLAASNLVAPIADITVSEGSGGASSDTIEASYRLGDRTVQASFPVSKVGSDWRLERPVATVAALSSVYPDQLSLRLNGVPVTTEAPMLFPGAYTVTADDTRYAISAGSFTLESPDDRPDTSPMRLALSTEGRSQVRAAAQKKLNSCVKQHSLKPTGCGFSTRLPSGNKARTSTIKWRITKGSAAMKKLKPTVDAGDPTLAQASTDVQLKVTFRSTNGLGWYGYAAIYAVRADLSGSGVRVTFG